MTLSYSGIFTPSVVPKISKDNKGQCLWVRIFDESDLVLDLTNVLTVELEFQYGEDITSRITKTAVKNDSANGMAIYITIADLFPKVGTVTCKPVLTWSASSDFPNGRKIKSYKCDPATLLITD